MKRAGNAQYIEPMIEEDALVVDGDEVWVVVAELVRL